MFSIDFYRNTNTIYFVIYIYIVTTIFYHIQFAFKELLIIDFLKLNYFHHFESILSLFVLHAKIYASCINCIRSNDISFVRKKSSNICRYFEKKKLIIKSSYDSINHNNAIL